MIIILACVLIFAFSRGKVADGGDTAEVLQRAEEGAPLRVAALGGSITLGGEGWIGPWLKVKFPHSTTYVQNAGLGGTGSDLGVFRLDRDVIEYQPDLVFIEFCVNDGSTPDEDSIRNLESIIVRLRKLERPPAIVMLIAAERNGGSKKAAFLRVARHYGLLVIDLDEALHRHLAEENIPWTNYMQDDVHPNEKGHAFYAGVIADALEKRMKAGGADASWELPAPLSERPLLLDAAMLPVVSAPGWTREDAPPGREFRSFPGMISASTPGTVLRVPFRGTEVGLFFPTSLAYGSFYASVDGRAPQQIVQNTSEGYGFQMLASDLAPGEHTLSLVVPPMEPETRSFKVNGPVKMGFVLVAGPASGAPGPEAPAGWYSEEVISALRFQPIPAESMIGTGPYSRERARKEQGELKEIYPPEEPAIRGVYANDRKGPPIHWATLPPGDVANLAAQAPMAGSRVFYVATRLISAKGGPALLRMAIKGPRQIWMNGRRIALGRTESETDRLVIVPVELREGANDLLWKIGTAGEACTFAASVADVSGAAVVLQNPLTP